MVNNLMNDIDQNLVHTYNRFPVMFERGEGVYLIDREGKRYLDFAAGIAVSSLGYSNQEWKDAMKEQIDKLCHISNLYYAAPMAEAAVRLKQASQMDRVFFTNSGAEAIEGVLKSARKYAYKKGSGRYEFIAMKHSFHGRSMGALSVTGTEKYRVPFEPLIDGVKFAEYNNLDSVKELITDKTCAVIMETLQGEGGIYPVEAEFIKGVRRLCDENDMLLILDEIQCGMGRTGSMFAWQQYGVKPDLMAMAKAIGNGVPVGAFAMTEETAKYSLEPGDHGTTYGGNPLVCAAVAKVLEIYEEEHIVEHVQTVSVYLEQKLDELVASTECLTERRGKGLIQGIVTTKPVGEVVSKALGEGLVVISAGNDVIRMVPPLIIEKTHVDEMIKKIKKALA